MTSPLIDENALMRRIEGIERDLRELGPSIAQSFGTTVAAIQAQQTELETQQATLATQQAALTAQQTALETQQDELDAQQATLTATVADLAAAVADIEELVDEQIATREDHDSADSFNITTTATTRATATITVPTGYTAAVLSVYGGLYAYNGGGAKDVAGLLISVNGSSPAFSWQTNSTAVGDIGSCTAAESHELTGLTGGSTITVELDVVSANVSWTAFVTFCTVQVVGIFYKS